MGWVGLGGTMAHHCITACSEECSLASTFARRSKALRSSKVIPANTPFHGCKYSTGTGRTIWYGCNCYCQILGRHPDLQYSIGLYCNKVKDIHKNTIPHANLINSAKKGTAIVMYQKKAAHRAHNLQGKLQHIQPLGSQTSSQASVNFSRLAPQER